MPDAFATEPEFLPVNSVCESICRLGVRIVVINAAFKNVDQAFKTFVKGSFQGRTVHLLINGANVVVLTPK